MKKLMLGVILVVMLDSCTYNTSTIQPDKVVKEGKNDEVKQSEVMSVFKTERAIMINSCNAAYDCLFMKDNGSDHFILLVQNYIMMNSNTENITGKAADFCLNSVVLNIPSQFHIVLRDEDIAQNLDCFTNEWSEWHLLDKKKKNRH
jgi:hypothetical protein